jgi:hypothetical protein
MSMFKSIWMKGTRHEELMGEMKKKQLAVVIT